MYWVFKSMWCFWVRVLVFIAWVLFLFVCLCLVVIYFGFSLSYCMSHFSVCLSLSLPSYLLFSISSPTFSIHVCLFISLLLVSFHTLHIPSYFLASVTLLHSLSVIRLFPPSLPSLLPFPHSLSPLLVFPPSIPFPSLLSLSFNNKRYRN